MNHILVVDDEPLMRTWLSKSIPKHSTCFDVPNTAQDGIEAIEYLKQAAYDVVITDIKMPGMDGLNLCHHYFWFQRFCLCQKSYPVWRKGLSFEAIG